MVEALYSYGRHLEQLVPLSLDGLLRAAALLNLLLQLDHPPLLCEMVAWGVGVGGGRQSRGNRRGVLAHIVTAYLVMAYVVMAYLVMAYTVMAYTI